jgi:hypothetical protein
MAITRERFTEGSSGYIRAQIVDSDGEPVLFNDLTAATLTLYDHETYVPLASPVRGIINGRDHQDILAAGLSPASMNDVAYEDNGYFTWTVQDDDNRTQTSRRQMERHIASFHFEFPGGAFNYAVELDDARMRAS